MQGQLRLQDQLNAVQAAAESAHAVRAEVHGCISQCSSLAACWTA